MKKIFGLLLLAFTMSSCYDDYVEDYKYNAVYFTYQTDVRTVVVGEGMKFDFGVAFGGAAQNTKDRTVEYVIDPSLVTPEVLASMKGSSLAYIKSATTPVAAFSVLPSNYYTLSDASKFVIAQGEQVGRVTFRPDSASFLADANTLLPNYVLPLKLVKADADTILDTKKTSVIAVKFENMLFGNYWHGGVTEERDVNTDTIVKQTAYYTAIPSDNSKVWTLSTVAPFELTSNAFSEKAYTTQQQLKISIDPTDLTKVSVGKAVGATYSFEQDGDCVFNNPRLLQNRKIVIKYKYKLANGNTCHATDTLTFRNRIRDGVNEWQDENPNHY